MGDNVKRVDVESWFGAPPKPKKERSALQTGDIAPLPEEIDALIRESAGDGRKFVAGVRRGVDALQDLASAGFTFDALVSMALEKAPYPRGAKNRLTREQMIAALKGAFSIGEYLS